MGTTTATVIAKRKRSTKFNHYLCFLIKVKSVSSDAQRVAKGVLEGCFKERLGGDVVLK